MVFHRCLVSHGFFGKDRPRNERWAGLRAFFSTFLLASQVSLEHLFLSFSRDTNDVLFFCKETCGKVELTRIDNIFCIMMGVFVKKLSNS